MTSVVRISQGKYDKDIVVFFTVTFKIRIAVLLHCTKYNSNVPTKIVYFDLQDEIMLLCCDVSIE